MSKTNEARLLSLFQIMQAELEMKEDFASVRLRNRMRKRAKIVVPGLEKQAFDNFKDLNATIPMIKVQCDVEILTEAKYFITRILENFNSKLSESNIQETLDVEYFFSLWRFGPGTSHNVKGTHTCDKISQKMSTTKSAETLVISLRNRNFYFHAFDSMNGSGISQCSGSKLAVVPKNEDTMRTIAIEPSGNMALQLAAGRYLEDVLRSIGLDITKQQDLNKNLARRGSIDGSLCTIDLKSASDMIQPELVRQLLPSKWYDLLMKIRSSTCNVDGAETNLNMISTMGNGFTFPLMTLCIVSLIYAMRRLSGGPRNWIDWTSTAVFGDDIILPTAEYARFTQILSDCGLIVNHDKSYHEGPFRESCGGDFFEGLDVTPFYIKSLLNDSEVYVAINQVLSWSSRHVILYKTLDYLIGLVKVPLLVPEWSNPDQGILTASCSRRYKFLQVVKHEVVLKNEFFLMPLACGGYVSYNGSDNVYSPRQYKTRWRVRKGVIPKGFTSGFNPLLRTIADSVKISAILSLMLCN